MPRPLPVLLLATFLITSPDASAQPADPRVLFQQAVELQKAGKLEAAADAYTAFLEGQPNNVEARSNLGVVFAGLGRYAEAIDAYRRALEIAPSNHAVRLNLGIALYKAARCPEAVFELSRVREAQPGNLQARYLEADCQMRMGASARVIELLSPLENTRPDDRVLAYLLGLAYLQEKQFEKGQLLVDRILRDGDSAEARLMMGVAKRGIQDLSGSLEDLGKAVELNPELPGVHSLYGRALLETGNRDRARTEFEAELARNPLDFDANLYLGVLLKDEAQHEAALGHFERALGVRPGDPGVRYQIATIHVARGETETALPLLESIVEEAPQFLEAHVTLATVYYRLKRREDGDRERQIVEKLNREIQAKQPGAVAPNRTP
ncbi:MAG TPA: tetratricopeptide repeat protein [Vicinamibacterales bacterium]